MSDRSPATGPAATAELSDFDPIGASVLGAEVLGGAGPSPRARKAETLAQLVLDDQALAARLQALVRQAAVVTGAENGQLTMISTREIAVIVERGTRRPPGDGGAVVGQTTSFEDTFGAVSMRTNEPMTVPDTRHDSRVASVPAVKDGVVGAYLGCPLRSLQGLVMGVLCVYDAHPHDWSSAEARALDVLAARASACLNALDAADSTVSS